MAENGEVGCLGTDYLADGWPGRASFMPSQYACRLIVKLASGDNLRPSARKSDPTERLSMTLGLTVPSLGAGSWFTPNLVGAHLLAR